MLFSPIPRNLSIPWWEAWKQPMYPSCFGCCDMMPLRFNPPPNPWSEPSREFTAEPSSETRKVRKKKVRALRVSDDSDDRCFFSSFCSSDGSCLIVKKNTYTSVAWDKNLQLSILSSWIRLNLIYFLFNWIAHDSYIRNASESFLLEVFLRPLPGARLRGVTAVVPWKVHLTCNDDRILDSHWRRGE